VDVLSQVAAENAALAIKQAAAIYMAQEAAFKRRRSALAPVTPSVEESIPLISERMRPSRIPIVPPGTPVPVSKPAAPIPFPERAHEAPGGSTAEEHEGGLRQHGAPRPAAIPIEMPSAAPKPPQQPAAVPKGAERRSQARHSVDTSALILLVNVASRLEGRIENLSVGGCRIRTRERFPVGIYTRVETEFFLEGLPFRLGGVVQAIQDRFHVGIRFLDMSERKREQLAQLIDEITELSERDEASRSGAEG
jgi:hypothetical protein